MSIALHMPLGMPKVEFLPLEKNSLVRKFILLEEWHYVLGGRHIIIPKDFIFDGASIPRIFTAIYSPIGYLLIAAIIHDFLYKYGYFIEQWNNVHHTIDGVEKPFRTKVYVSRIRADLMFKRIAIIEYPEHKIKTWTAYKTLQAGGWVTWNKHRRDIHK